MARLIFSAITSLDGYVEDDAGGFDWAAPDDEVLGFLNDLKRAIGTYLYGRRTPVVVGGGKAALPQNVRLDLELVAERRFSNGVMLLDYRLR